MDLLVEEHLGPRDSWPSDPKAFAALVRQNFGVYKTDPVGKLRADDELYHYQNLREKDVQRWLDYRAFGPLDYEHDMS